MNQTLELIKILGSSSASTFFAMNKNKFAKLCHLSRKNRMLFFYLQALDRKSLGNLSSIYQKESTRYTQTIDAIARVSKTLRRANVKHAIYKTIRPYKSTTVDIDIIIFGDKSNYSRSAKTMKDSGYKFVVKGPRSTTFWDQKTEIGIDLYEEIAVSYINYIDKEKLVEYTTDAKLPNGDSVSILKPEADLSCIIAHSIIKEQMYTLSEYHTFIHYLKQMNINNFLQIVKQNNITSAARTHASITALLHRAAHKTIPEKLQQILEILGEDKFETTRLIHNNFETPHKYHPITVAKSVLEITKGRKCRNSIAMQIYHMLNPNFTKKFLKELLQHIRRETY